MRLNRPWEPLSFIIKDIYHGKGQFEGIPLDTRLAVFRAMTSVLADTIKPAILVQSADPDVLGEVAGQVDLPELPAPLTLTSPHGFAFLGVLLRVCDYVAQIRHSNEQAVVFCDQGIFKPGYSLRFAACPGIIYKDWVHFQFKQRTWDSTS